MLYTVTKEFRFEAAHKLVGHDGKCARLHGHSYVPNERVVGLSKMARLVDCFARRLQIQEKMRQDIATSMMNVLVPKGVGVVVEATHLCMSCRGVQKHGADMVTACLLGVFRQPEVRAEFFGHCRGRAGV